MLLLGFDELLGQGFFGAARRIEGRNHIYRRAVCAPGRAFSPFTDKDTAGGVVAVVACVDADAVEAGDIIQEREWSAELG